MLRNFLISTARSIAKNKVYSVINVLGLSVSFVAIFFIVQYVHFERSFDQYHSKADRIFRVGMELIYENSSTLSAGSFYGMGEQSGLDLGQVEDYFTMTFDNANQGFLSYDDGSGLKNFRLNSSHSVSPSILTILDFDFIEGSPETGLTGTTNVVITRSLAQRIFNGQQALGKTLTWHDNTSGDVTGTTYQVGAVIEDLPANSHFGFELLFPLKSFEEAFPEYRANVWQWYGYYNYLLLKSPEDKESLEEAYPEFIERHLRSQGRLHSTSIFLEPLTDIRLKSEARYQIEEGGDDQAINILALISLLLAVLAYTNYTNLMTSINLQRVKEVGIRKVLGSNQRQVLYRFLLEAVVINLLSFLLALVLINSLKNPVQNWIQDYPEPYLLESIPFWLLSLGLVLALSILTGIYPATVVSKLKNTEVLKGSFSRSGKGRLLHKIMVTMQFAIAAVLLLFTLVINQQLRFMFNKDLGVNIDQVMVARAPFVTSGSYSEAITTFQNSVAGIPGVSAAAASTMVPGIPRYGNSVRLKGREDEGQVVRRMAVDDDYVKVYQHEIVAGRAFSKEFGGDENKAMVNEKVVELFGLTPDEFIGKTLFMSDTVEIVGVIKDYHHNSVKSEILPVVMTKTDDDIYYISMRLQTTDLARTRDQLQQAWEASFPGSPFDTFFADENFERLYLKERKFSRIIAVFTGAALFIACLGIFGLSLFTVIRRRKEIGVRKVLGAPLLNLFWTFSREIFSLILMAGVLSIPASYLFVNSWLDGFANRIGLSLSMLLLPIVATLAFALVAIGYNILKALRVNPSETLRNE